MPRLVWFWIGFGVKLVQSLLEKFVVDFVQGDIYCVLKIVTFLDDLKS